LKVEQADQVIDHCGLIGAALLAKVKFIVGSYFIVDHRGICQYSNARPCLTTSTKEDDPI